MADPAGPAGPPPREAIDYLQRKQVRTGWHYQEVWKQEHAAAFTVAKMMQVDLLEDVQRSLAEALQQGKPFEQWRKEMAKELADRGWWGKQEVIDPKTGKKEAEIQLGSSRRLKTIWDTNVGQAYMAGIWERGMRSTSHPYLIYRLGPSKEHRAAHVAWNGLLLPREDSFWDAAYPRNGWGCKCTARFVSRAQAERYRRAGKAPGGAKLQTKAPTLEPETYYNKRTGQTHQGIAGIDRGFEYNVGKSRRQQLDTAWTERDRVFAGTMEPAPGSTPPAAAFDPTGAGPHRPAVEETLRAMARVHGVTGLPLDDQGKVKRMQFAAIDTTSAYAGTAWDPVTGEPRVIEISRGAADDDMGAFAAAHEIGHRLDYTGEPWSASEAETTPEMRAVMAAIRRSPTYLDLPPTGLASDREVWARAYAQYLAWRSGSSTLKNQLDRLLTDDHLGQRALHWPYDEFAPIAATIDRLMEARQWARTKKDA